MNLRISEGYLRFRVTREEMDLLLGGRMLSFRLPLGSRTAEYSIAANGSRTPLELDVQENSWKLLVNIEDLKRFAASLPSREGMEQEVILGGIPLKLALEVDVRRNRGT